MPEEQFFKALQEENRQVLDRIEITEKDVRKTGRLGTGAAFYLGRFFEKSREYERAGRFYRQEYEKGTGIWRVQAGHRLLRLLLEESRFEEAEIHCLDMLKTVLDTTEVLRDLIEVQYNLKKFQSVIDTISLFQAAGGKEDDEEVALMRAVALYETGHSGWNEAVKDLFLDYPASEVHSRLYLYLEYNRLLESRFSELEQEMFLWKHLTGAEDYAGSAETAAEVIHAASADVPGMAGIEKFFLRRENVKELETMFLRSGFVLEGAEALKKLQPDSGGEEAAPVYLLHAIGRLLMNGGDLTGAEEYFRKGMAGSRTKAEYDRELWYLLYTVFKRSPGTVPGLLIRYAETWNNPVYFADILEDAGAYLARTGQWRELEDLSRQIENYMDPGTSRRFAFILAEAGRYGYLESSSPDGSRWAERAIEADSYYAVLQGISSPELDRPGSIEAAGEETSQLEDFLLGHLTFGLYAEAAEDAAKHVDELSPAVLKTIISRLSLQGYYREGILLSRDLKKRHPLEIDRSVMMSVYPRGFRELVAVSAKQEGIPENLLNGLIRVESAFDNDISSHAGAVGLTQLMPGTARETAGKMGREEIELTDPDFSISVGARYFADMYKLYGSYMYALFAYNAGPGRMRSWMKSFGHLPPILFLEALPFRETREYGRKVLVATAYYQYLYENRPIRESVELFFPDVYGDIP